MSTNVLVYCEQRDNVLQKVSLELIGKGKELADTLGQKVVAVILGKGVQPLAQELIDYGADEVVYVDHEYLADYMTEPFTKAFTAVIKAYTPEIVLIGATAIGRDLAPRTSARIKTGLTADCTGLDISADEKKELLMTRPAFGGNIMATILCSNHRPQMATVRPGVMVVRKKEPRKGAITPFAVEFKESDKNVKILKTVKQEKKRKDITEAKILVSGGRGVGAAEKFGGMLQKLADTLKAEVSASRGAVDKGFAEKDRQVGQTGKTVRPNLYFALGISGAIQHVAGMEGSDLIIAVNKDPQAQIFQYADLGVVGDVNKIVPKLAEAIAKERTK
jgi:electron transfer flavoprotein alpha subunit